MDGQQIMVADGRRKGERADFFLRRTRTQKREKRNSLQKASCKMWDLGNGEEKMGKARRAFPRSPKNAGKRRGRARRAVPQIPTTETRKSRRSETRPFPPKRPCEVTSALNEMTHASGREISRSNAKRRRCSKRYATHHTFRSLWFRRWTSR